MKTDIAARARSLSPEYWPPHEAYIAYWENAIDGLGVSVPDYTENQWENLRAETGLTNDELHAIARAHSG